MYPSHNSLKLVHDQMIREELERHRAYEGQTPRQHRLSQTLGKALARFTARADRKQETAPSCANQRESCTLV